ncbi:AAA family ATPase [Rhizobium cauense]|uniref:AAA family ATPase n=1 Tax=Rhizobium cauense TaxID=1166683 RepID=UPI001C6E10A7|nr:AAA family ATPase [Rhizobium cauense]MBW9116623.1 AAA family ATPase [Rhizobium cauense]
MDDSFADRGKREPEVFLDPIAASSFKGRPIPAREFIDGFEFFPVNEVSYLAGMGAVGKTTLALQLAAAVAIPATVAQVTHFLGRPVNRRGPVMFYSSEDDEYECQRKLEDIAAAECFDIGHLSKLLVYDHAARLDKALLESRKQRDLTETPIFKALMAEVERHRPELVILDNKAQIVDADELQRGIATKVGNILGHYAKLHGTTFVILAHPSLTGINQKTGASGSTGWVNTGRANIYMRPPDEKEGASTDDYNGQLRPDDGRRVLVVQKANLTQQGRVVNIQRDCGCYRCTDKPKRADDGIGRESKAERVFQKLLSQWAVMKNELSSSPEARGLYAPSAFFRNGDREGVSLRELERAMFSLLQKGEIENREIGNGTRKRNRLFFKLKS